MIFPRDLASLADQGQPCGLWGVIRLAKGYNGPTCQVTSGEGDFYEIYTARDLVALPAGNDFFVSALYDQSGNERDFLSSTAGQQPQVVDASTGPLRTPAGTPMLHFDGTDDRMVLSIPTGLTAGTGWSILTVLKSANTGTNRVPWTVGSASSTLEYMYMATGNAPYRNRLSSNGGDARRDSTGQEEQFHVDTMHYTLGANVEANPGGLAWRQNGILLLSGPATVNNPLSTDDLSSTLGARAGGSLFFQGDFVCWGMWPYRINQTSKYYTVIESWAKTTY